MHSAITWGSLFGVGFIIAGLFGMAIGFLVAWAGGMSDAPQEGDAYSARGCLVCLLSVGVFILGCALLR